MYCSACGTQLQPGLAFCSRCGKRVTDQTVELSRHRTPIAAASNIAGVGFVAFIFVLLVLVLNGVVNSNIVGVTFFYFLALFLICYMLMRQGRLAAKYEPQQAPTSEQLYVKPATTAQLPEPTERPASVTEHTTRTLDHVPLERN